MELPSDPANLVYGIYDKMGRDLTKERLESKYEYWALSDEKPTIEQITINEIIYELTDCS